MCLNRLQMFKVSSYTTPFLYHSTDFGYCGCKTNGLFDWEKWPWNIKLD